MQATMLCSFFLLQLYSGHVADALSPSHFLPATGVSGQSNASGVVVMLLLRTIKMRLFSKPSAPELKCYKWKERPS